MSTRSSDRAEARRRARMAARGELPPAPEPEPQAPQSSEGGFLRRIFPPAPPLPGRPNPLSGFDPSGPMRPIRERLFLLRRGLLAWLGLGLLAGFGYFLSLSGSGLALIGTFVHFGALIAAGWFGWQRPTLYGTAAGAVGALMVIALILYDFALRGAGPGTFLSEGGLVNLVFVALTQLGLGFVGGWYGGYLRRRQTQLSADVRRRR